MNREKRATITVTMAQRAEALLRSLAGIAAVRVELAGTQVAAVYVVPASEGASRGLVRNVQSGLMAALGISIEPRLVLVVPELPAKVAPAPTVVSAPKAVQKAVEELRPQPVPTPEKSGGFRPVPRIEVLELQRLNQDQLQCRVVVEVGGHRRAGTAQAGEEREGAVTLAARATLDAMKRIEAGDWLFEGAADVIIAGRRHIVVSVRKHEEMAPLSGAAAVDESVEHAVAVAVLNAAGVPAAGNMKQTFRPLARQS
jgi:hypothetical protein